MSSVDDSLLQPAIELAVRAAQINIVHTFLFLRLNDTCSLSYYAVTVKSRKDHRTVSLRCANVTHPWTPKFLRCFLAVRQ